MRAVPRQVALPTSRALAHCPTQAPTLAVAALGHAVALRRPAGTVVHSGRGSQFRSRKYVHALHANGLVGSMGRIGMCRQRPPPGRSENSGRNKSTRNAGGAIAEKACCARALLAWRDHQASVSAPEGLRRVIETGGDVYASERNNGTAATMRSP